LVQVAQARQHSYKGVRVLTAQASLKPLWAVVVAAATLAAQAHQLAMALVAVLVAEVAHRRRLIMRLAQELLDRVAVVAWAQTPTMVAAAAEKMPLAARETPQMAVLVALERLGSTELLMLAVVVAVDISLAQAALVALAVVALAR
jgi:hypothetical protein